MNLLDFRTTPMWQAWDAVGELAAEDGVELAESELIGLAPLAALLDVADHAERPGRRRRSRRASRPPRAAIRLRDFTPLMALELRLAAAPRRRRAATGMTPPPHRGRSRQRRTPRGSWSTAPSQVATLAGRPPPRRRPGRRRGPRRGRGRRPGSPDAPVVALLGGPDRRASGRATEVEARPRGATGMPLARFARLDADGGVVTPGLVDPHTHLLFAGTREGELVLRQRGAGYLEILAAGGGILSTVAATRAADRRRSSPRHGRRWLDEMLRPRRHHGRGQVRLRARPRHRAAPARRSPTQLGREGPVDVVPTFLGAHAVPPEFRARPDGTEAYVRSVIEEQLPGVAAQGRARVVRRVLRAGRVHGRPEPADPPGRGRLRDGAPPPRRRARPVRRRGAGGGARRAVRGPPPHAERRGRRPRSPRRPAADHPTVATLLPGHDLVPHGRRAGARRAGSSTPGCPSRWARTSTPAPRPRRTCRW